MKHERTEDRASARRLEITRAAREAKLRSKSFLSAGARAATAAREESEETARTAVMKLAASLGIENTAACTPDDVLGAFEKSEASKTSSEATIAELRAREKELWIALREETATLQRHRLGIASARVSEKERDRDRDRDRDGDGDGDGGKKSTTRRVSVITTIPSIARKPPRPSASVGAAVTPSATTLRTVSRVSDEEITLAARRVGVFEEKLLVGEKKLVAAFKRFNRAMTALATIDEGLNSIDDMIDAAFEVIGRPSRGTRFPPPRRSRASVALKTVDESDGSSSQDGGGRGGGIGIGSVAGGGRGALGGLSQSLPRRTSAAIGGRLSSASVVAVSRARASVGGARLSSARLSSARLSSARLSSARLSSAAPPPGGREPEPASKSLRRFSVGGAFVMESMDLSSSCAMRSNDDDDDDAPIAPAFHAELPRESRASRGAEVRSIRWSPSDRVGHT